MSIFTKAQRRLQDHFGSRKLADAIEQSVVEEELNESHIDFIQSRDFFFLSTVNACGEPTVSYKGGDVGTVRAVDRKTLIFPAYDGNGMFLSMGNIEETAKIGLLFIDFETPNRVRVQATAQLQVEGPLLAEFPGAIGVVSARIDKVFINCARYVHKHRRLEQSRYVPDGQGKQPHASWKRIGSLQPFLNDDDRARTRLEGGEISEQEYGVSLSRGES